MYVIKCLSPNFHNNFEYQHFQALAKFMILLNILLPTLCFTFVFTDNSLGLHICLGEGFQSFFSTSMSFCPNDNLFASISCYTLLSVLGVCMSDVIDGYCTFCCAREIKKSTENTKSMMTNKAYINRTR